jgi:hypothetical protein
MIGGNRTFFKYQRKGEEQDNDDNFTGEGPIRHDLDPEFPPLSTYILNEMMKNGLLELIIGNKIVITGEMWDENQESGITGINMEDEGWAIPSAMFLYRLVVLLREEKNEVSSNTITTTSTSTTTSDDGFSFSWLVNVGKVGKSLATFLNCTKDGQWISHDYRSMQQQQQH